METIGTKLAKTRRRWLLLLSALFLTACGSTPPERTADGSGPILLVAFTTNEDVRVRFENRLNRDLATRGVRATSMHRLLPGFDAVTPPTVLRAAGELDAPVILMVRRLIAELPGDGTEPPPEVQRHRTLMTYFDNVDRTRLPTVPPPGRQVIEVAAYRRDGGGRTTLVWSGYSWVDFDGDLESAIRQTSETIAENLAGSAGN